MPYVSRHDCVENDNNPRPMEEFIDNSPACVLLVESYSGKSVSCPNPKCIGRGIARCRYA